ncbi:MAG: ATP-binding cassette domain-containing protein [Cyclobacteriaceae bacterium]|nr:ATP-binding cassette domain-containing protein [Cyclobacteriaceae bacterium]
MSEQLLEAVILLFSYIARLDGAGEKERAKMMNLLVSRLNKEVIGGYMDMFDRLCANSLEQKDAGLVKITEIARKINGQIAYPQKVFLMSELTQLIYADNVLSEEENLALYNIGRELKIDPDELKMIQDFVAADQIADFNSPNILIVSSKTVGLPALCLSLAPEGEIDGFIAVLCLNSIKPFFMRYLGNSNVFLNQIPMESSKVEIAPPGSTLRSSRFRAIYYSDLHSRFRSEEHKTNIVFKAEHVSYKFKKGKLGLRDISISETNGTLMGVMGASGSGKSTLLNVLNGNENPASGRVLINGVDIHREQKKIEGLIGYVPQDDLLMDDLTVFQNLYYAAKLCFSHYTGQQIVELVNKVLVSLGLFETRNLKVGNPLQKIISGGQRKRLNIGLELLREPMVLYVDEPTSGLSSRDSENIMDLLKELSLRGKLVFVVIHQPSSDIFKMFDKLLILDVGGYPIYYGNPVEAVVYFKEAARLIDRQTGSCAECGNVNAEQIFNIIETRVVDEYGRHTEQRKYTPTTWHEIYERRVSLPEIEKISEKPKVVLHIPDRWRQFAIFTIRDLRSKLANRQYVLINFLEAPLLAVLLAVLMRFFPSEGFRSFEYSFQENVNIPAYIFIGVIVALFMGLTVSAEEIIKDKKILKRETFLHLSKGSYIASKLVLLFGLSAIQTASFVILGNMILDIQGMYFPYWLVFFSASCFANILGLNISASFNSAVTIYILIPILLIPQILLSGVVVQFDQLNPAFGAKSRVPFIGDMMISRWAYEALMVNQFKNNKFERLFYDLDKQIALSDYKTVYYLPRLESELEYAFINRNSGNSKTREEVDVSLQLLRNEINSLLQEFGKDKFTLVDELTASTLDSATFRSAQDFLHTLTRIYINRNTLARKAKDTKIKEMTASPAKADAYNELKQSYTNDQVTSLVFDNKEKTRILEHKGKLIQQIYPIFSLPEPVNYFDFRALFYVPVKYFAGRYFETLYFNVFIMWCMTFLMVLALYFDVLKKIVSLDWSFMLFRK